MHQWNLILNYWKLLMCVLRTCWLFWVPAWRAELYGVWYGVHHRDWSVLTRALQNDQIAKGASLGMYKWSLLGALLYDDDIYSYYYILGDRGLGSYTEMHPSHVQTKSTGDARKSELDSLESSLTQFWRS